MRALILSEEVHRGALTAVRSLARDGWRVGAGVPVTPALPGSSRAVEACHLVPRVHDGAAAMLAAVNDAIAERGYEVVFSCDDPAIFGLSSEREKLNAVFPYGDHATVTRGLDKLALTHEAQRSGLAVPRTEVPGEEEFEGFGAAPIVVKPRFTFVEGVSERISASVEPDVQSARARVAQLREVGAEPILQEYFPGRLMAFVAVTDRDARVVVCLQQIADAIWPPEVGVSARAHTIPVDEALAVKAGRLLEAIGWFGLAQLQFMIGADGVPRLVDFNGRFYGSLALGVGAGPNLPAIWARLATGRPVGRVPQARVGVRFQWFNYDLRANLAGKSARGRAGAVLASVARAVGAKHSLWRAGDPGPALAKVRSKLTQWISRG